MSNLNKLYEKKRKLQDDLLKLQNKKYNGVDEVIQSVEKEILSVTNEIYKLEGQESFFVEDQDCFATNSAMT